MQRSLILSSSESADTRGGWQDESTPTCRRLKRENLIVGVDAPCPKEERRKYISLHESQVCRISSTVRSTRAPRPHYARRNSLHIPDVQGEMKPLYSSPLMVEIPSYAALRIGGFSGVLLMRAVAASSRTSPQIRDTTTLTSALKPVRRPTRNSMTPTLKIQLLKSHAENMTTLPERR